jgi:DNA-binding NarL/FixJ family response regulator
VVQIRVAILDQQRTFADALAARLDLEHDLAVVGVVHSAKSAMGLTTGGRADIVLLDGDLPGDAAFSFCAQTTGRDGAPHVIMLSATSEAERIVTALRAGAAAWVRKDESVEQLMRVLRGVARGETWLPPAELGLVLRLLLRHEDEQRGHDQLLAVLTPREREVLSRLAEGAGRRDVAEQLHVSANTVRAHLQNVMSKLGVHSAVEAVALSQARLDHLSLPGSGGGVWPPAEPPGPFTMSFRLRSAAHTSE